MRSIPHENIGNVYEWYEDLKLKITRWLNEMSEKQTSDIFNIIPFCALCNSMLIRNITQTIFPINVFTTYQYILLKLTI